MRRIFSISTILVVAAFLLVCGCVEKEDEYKVGPLSSSYQEGYQAGFDTGYVQGELDNDRGREQNSTPPLPQGNYNDEYKAGFSNGYVSGYDAGYQAKMKANPLYQKGYRDGFQYGAEEGYTDYMKDEAVSQFNVDADVEGYEEYITGYNEGAEAGYTYGVEKARNGETPPDDWYADFTATYQGEGTGFSTERSWLISEYIIGLWSHTTGEGYFDVSFEEDGTCCLRTMDFIDYGNYDIDERNETMTLLITRTESYPDGEESVRPEQFTEKQVWRFGIEENPDGSGPMEMYLIDPAGWEYRNVHWPD